MAMGIDQTRIYKFDANGSNTTHVEKQRTTTHGADKCNLCEHPTRAELEVGTTAWQIIV
jgi:hypothetical protein